MRIWKWLVRLYPEEFRSEYGRDLLDDLEERSRMERSPKFYVEAASDVAATAWKEHWRIMIRDFVHSFRRMLAFPGMAAVAILSLALGIGVNTTMFSVVYAALLRPLPYPDSDSRVIVSQVSNNSGSRQSFDRGATTADFMDWRETSKTLDQWHMFTRGNATTALGNSLPERIVQQSVTPGLLEALGVRPLLGRFPQAGEEESRPAVISEDYWKRSFGGDRNVLGRRIGLGNERNTIIGIVPTGFEILNEPSQVDLLTLVSLTPGSNWVQRSVPWVLASARLKPGFTIEQAQAEMNAIAAGLEATYPATNKKRGVKLTKFIEVRNGGLGEILYPLFGAVGFVLLIACANVANLLLARASARRREVSVRAAIGATRGRLVREFLMDGAVLAIPGIAAGVALAYGGVQLFRVAVVPQGFPGASLVQINLPVLLFTAAAGALASIGAAFIPALQGTRVELTEALKESGRGSGSKGRQFLRSALVGAEIALALVLLVATALMVNRGLRLAGMDLGFNPADVTVVQLDLVNSRYMTNAPKREIDMRNVEPVTGQFIERALEAVRTLPGIQHAAFGAGIPMGPIFGPGVRVRIVGGSENANELRSALFNSITSGYFETLRIPVKLGRAINDRDTQGSPWVAVVNEAFAREFFPNGDALGQVVMLNVGQGDRQREIVGVVGDTKQISPREPSRPEVFASHFQQPREIPGTFQGQRFRSSLIFRTNGSAPPSAERLARLVASLDKDVPLVNVRTHAEHISLRTGVLRFYTNALGLFSSIALLLAAIGIYGLMSHAVTDRVHEIGIRSSLGASRGQIIWLIGSYGCKLALAGIAVGLMGGWAVTRLLQSTFIGVEPDDPAMMAVTSVILFSVSLCACVVPALRAARIDPAIALRQE